MPRTRRLTACFSLALSMLLIVFLSPALAVDMSLFSRFEYLWSESEITNKDTGEQTVSEFNRFKQFYNLGLSAEFFPNLRLSGGGVLELENTESKTNGSVTESDRRLRRPFIDLSLRSPLLTAGVGYRRTEIKRDLTGLPTTTDDRDQYSAHLDYQPAGLPRLILNYSHAQRESEPDRAKSESDQYTLESRYDYRGLNTRYRFEYLDRNDILNDVLTRGRTHTGNVSYSTDFYNNRLNFDTSYRIRYDLVEAAGTGAADISVLASQGISSLDDTPEDGPALEDNFSLIDGNLTASSGINIGTGGDQATSVNIGLDLATVSEVESIFVWVDRTLLPGVADSFAWDVYTSPDNTDQSTWTLRATVFPADFSSLDNRFEIRFPTVATRFIKVVTRPLSPSVPGAVDFADILVTEIGAFSRIRGGDTFESVDHRYNMGLTWKVSSKTTARYEFFYRLEEFDPGGRRDVFKSHGIDVKHVFNRVFTGIFRAFRGDEDRRQQKTTTNSFGLALRATYLPTFSQNLTYDANFIEEEGVGDSSTHTVFLRNNARLYRGWSAFLDLGYSLNKFTDQDSTRTLARVGTKVVPNEMLNFDMNYQVQWIESSREPSRVVQASNLQAFFSPLPTLSLFARWNYVDTEETSRTFQSYSANWLPFRGGALSFFINYNETISSQRDEETTTLSPGLDWRISRRTILSVTYSKVDRESENELVDSQSISANLRITL